MTRFTFHKEQQAFKAAILSGTKKRIAVAAARRCGKSELIARTMIGIAATTKSNILIYTPTLQQTEQIYRQKFYDIFLDPRIAILCESFNKTKNEYTFHTGSRILLGSAENLERREGVDWHYIVCDEASDIPPGKLPIDSGLLPATARTDGVIVIAGVPKAISCGGAIFKALYNKWKEETETDSIYAAYGWSYEGLIPEEKAIEAREEMTPRDFKEHFGGVFTEIQGEVYYAFTEQHIVHNTEFTDDIIYVSTDWNVNPMAWVFLQEQEGKLIAVDMLYQRNTNTYECCTILKRYLATLPTNNPLIFLGDSTGSARKTSAIYSDVHIIRQNFPDSQLRYAKVNPSVDLRIASVNNAFHRKRLFVDARCAELIKDLESTSYKPGTLQIDERDPDRGHAVDAMGYCVYAKMPIQNDNPSIPSPGGIHVQSKEILPQSLQKYEQNTGIPAKKATSSPFVVAVKRRK